MIILLPSTWNCSWFGLAFCEYLCNDKLQQNSSCSNVTVDALIPNWANQPFLVPSQEWVSLYNPYGGYSAAYVFYTSQQIICCTCDILQQSPELVILPYKVVCLPSTVHSPAAVLLAEHALLCVAPKSLGFYKLSAAAVVPHRCLNGVAIIWWEQGGKDTGVSIFYSLAELILPKLLRCPLGLNTLMGVLSSTCPGLLGCRAGTCPEDYILYILLKIYFFILKKIPFYRKGPRCAVQDIMGMILILWAPQ